MLTYELHIIRHSHLGIYIREAVASSCTVLRISYDSRKLPLFSQPTALVEPFVSACTELYVIRRKSMNIKP